MKSRFLMVFTADWLDKIQSKDRLHRDKQLTELVGRIKDLIGPTVVRELYDTHDSDALSRATYLAARAAAEYIFMEKTCAFQTTERKWTYDDVPRTHRESTKWIPSLDTGRIRCNQPEIQDPVWEKVFEPNLGYKLVDADFSSIESRIAGIVAPLKAGEDLYERIANEMIKPITHPENALGYYDQIVMTHKRTEAARTEVDRVGSKVCLKCKTGLTSFSVVKLHYRSPFGEQTALVHSACALKMEVEDERRVELWGHGFSVEVSNYIPDDKVNDESN